MAYRRDTDHDDQVHEHHADLAGPGPVVRAVDQDHEDTVLLIGSLTYAGTGWHTSGDALLANAAANLARS
jgi:hypothetical protein